MLAKTRVAGCARQSAAQSARPRTAIRASGQDLARAFSAVTAELEALTAALKKSPSPTPQPAPAAKKIKLEDAGGDQVLLCDENGCVLLDKKTNKSAGSVTPRNASLDTLLSGSGWVLGVIEDEADQAAASSSSLFGAVVGGSGWTVSLTQSELDDFVLALRTIHSTMRDLLVQQGGVSQEPLKVKWDTPGATVVMEATAPAGIKHTELHGFQVTWRIGAGRAVKATWSADTVAEVLDALDTYRAEQQAAAAMTARQSLAAASV